LAEEEFDHFRELQTEAKRCDDFLCAAQIVETMPDEKLPKQGELSTPAGIEKEARRMLADPNRSSSRARPKHG
jgi:hypothetical protein